MKAKILNSKQAQKLNLKYGSIFNRRGILRIALVIVLLAAIAVLQLLIFTGGETMAAEERADDAVQRVSAQFSQHVDGALRQLQLVAAGVDGEDGVLLLAALSENGDFSEVELLPAEADGGSYVRYVVDNLSAKIYTGEDGALQLRISLSDGRELAGWLDGEEINSILQSAYPEIYGYALYNAATGAYIANNTSFDDSGYYDTLLSLNEGGRTGKLMLAKSGQVYISGETDGSGYYIAQTATAIQPWSIALFLQEELVGGSDGSRALLFALVIAAAILELAALCLLVGHLVRSIRTERAQRAAESEFGACILRQTAEDAQTGIYIYDRESDSFRACFDGLHFVSEVSGSFAQMSFAAFASAYGLDEAEAELLHNRLRELRSGDRFELSLNCSSREHERMLRFELRRPQGTSMNCVVLSLRDASLESERADSILEEERFRRMMLPKSASVWQVNISRNRWYLTDGKADDAIAHLSPGANGWRNYSADLKGGLRDYIHPSDYPACVEMLSIEGVNAMVRAGRCQATLEYRTKAGEGYQWHRLLLRAFHSMDNGDLLANLYILNVDAEKNAELERQERARILQQTLTALGGIYDGLYYVDMDSGLSYTAKAHGVTASGMCQPYRQMISNYIEQNVHPDEQEGMRRLLESYNLRKRITEGNHLLRVEYRRRIGDHFEPAAVIVQAARFENGTIRDVVLAMRRYGDEKKVPETK